MKLLLTSAGVKNPSIHAALVDLLGKPIEESTALAVPTAGYGHPLTSPIRSRDFVAGTSELHMTDLGWRSVGLLELAALPDVATERWQTWVRGADAILVNGGCAAYLAHHVRRSGLLEMFPELHDTVWVGLSAGSLAMAPRLGADFVEWERAEDDRGLGLVDFSIFPHVDHPMLPENTMAEAERWASTLDNPSYAIDDDTAIRVVDGQVDVVSEGTWKKLR